MPIDGGLRKTLAPGTKLRGKHKGKEHTAEVVPGKDGGLRFRLADGREFASPSAAGKAVTGTACNGWRFWSLANGNQALSPPTAGSTAPAATAGATLHGSEMTANSAVTDTSVAKPEPATKAAGLKTAKTTKPAARSRPSETEAGCGRQDGQGRARQAEAGPRALTPAPRPMSGAGAMRRLLSWGAEAAHDDDIVGVTNGVRLAKGKRR